MIIINNHDDWINLRAHEVWRPDSSSVHALLTLVDATRQLIIVLVIRIILIIVVG